MNILVINCGSSSIKYQLIDTKQDKTLIGANLQGVKTGKAQKEAIGSIFESVSEFQIDAIGHRVVHGGDDFHEATLIDGSVIDSIQRHASLAPLHNPANLAGIRAAREVFGAIPHVAVFDTAFHARMPRRAKTYAIERTAAKKFSLRRYGFHGTSHSYVVKRAASFLEEELSNLRIISLHLGSGASACAIEFGSSVETSMGLTPLEGLVMGTRSGDLDPGIVLTLARELGVQKADELLNRQSGLLGLSGLTHDLREIQKQAQEGHDGARLAINVFAHRCRKYIGAYAAVMGGVDAIVLTGGIGENSVEMRQRILQRLEFLGVRIDEDRNADCSLDAFQPVFEISREHCRVRTLVVATNEELQIAKQTAQVVSGEKNIAEKRPIPIAISARHIHLDRNAMDVLFGKDSELTELRPLSQPGQFAAKERLTLIGPRGKIENVRILGPLRARPQVEISRTDEFTLGVDAPIRRSGKTIGSAPITLEGPNGRLHLEEGLICAWRHIHMTPQDAQTYGVVDGDHVEVAVSGGPRDLVFGDVLVRVKSSYVLEMHIDTDEANAAEMSSGAQGDLVYSHPSQNTHALLQKKR